ncbi:MAG: hypothetical protein ACO2O0_06430 [Desulfurococcales archaeon]
MTLTSLLTDLLIVPQPTVEFTSAEIQAIKSYLATRGDKRQGHIACW